jgi:hypothetical protein
VLQLLLADLASVSTGREAENELGVDALGLARLSGLLRTGVRKSSRHQGESEHHAGFSRADKTGHAEAKSSGAGTTLASFRRFMVNQS